MRVLGYIPARSGSKGVPGKNKKKLGALPLISYTIIAALASKKINSIFVSTDDPEIALIAQSYGIEIPRLRPETLAQDTTPIVPVIQSDLAYLEQLDNLYDCIVLLQPTNPFRFDGLIDLCIDKLFEMEADTLFTTLKVPDKFNPHWVFEYDDNNHLALSTSDTQIISRRQLLPPAFIREGSVYVMKRTVIEDNTLYGRNIAGIELDANEIVNIDTPSDWSDAEAKLDYFLSKNPVYKSQ